MVLQPDLNGFATHLNSFAMRDSNGLAMWIEWSGKVDQMVLSNNNTKLKVQSSKPR